MPSVPTSLPLALKIFLDFRAIFPDWPLDFFPAIRQVIWPSPLVQSNKLVIMGNAHDY